jgi:hypothetical protein
MYINRLHSYNGIIVDLSNPYHVYLPVINFYILYRRVAFDIIEIIINDSTINRISNILIYNKIYNHIHLYHRRRALYVHNNLWWSLYIMRWIICQLNEDLIYIYIYLYLIYTWIIIINICYYRYITVMHIYDDYPWINCLLLYRWVIPLEEYDD